MKNTVKNLYLILASMIWGFAFVAQSVAMDSIGPYTFISIRFVIGGLFLVILGLLSKQYKGINYKNLLVHGSICGLVLYVAATLQQIGMVYTPPYKAGFITVLYIVFVPILSIFVKKKPTLKNWFCVGLALVGLYLLCMKGSFSLAIGDTYILLSAFMFSIHIMVIDKYANMYSAIALNSIQYLSASIIGIIPAILLERFDLTYVSGAIIPILYAGIMSTGVAYTLQTVGQKDNDPTTASLLLSLESVFAAIGGFLLLHQSMSVRELIGCLIIFISIIIIQLPSKKSS